MSQPVDVTFGGAETHYCKNCNRWLSPGKPVYEEEAKCPNCKEVGFLIQNPFPDNLVPYVVLDMDDVL